MKADAIFKQVIECRKRQAGSTHTESLFCLEPWQTYQPDRGSEIQALQEIVTLFLSSEIKDLAFDQLHEIGMKVHQGKKYAEAQTLFQEVVEGREKLLGPEHQDTSASLHWLGRALYEQKMYDEAVEVFEKTGRFQKATLGPEHYDTLSTSQWHGFSLECQDKLLEASECYSLAAYGFQKNPGPRQL